MNVLKLPLLFLLIFSTSILTTSVNGQQKRRSVEKPAAKAPAPTPAPTPATFDTLLAADSFKVYVEVRGVGGLIRSSAVNDVLEPVLKLGGPPKDFTDFINWMKTHADQLTTSRMLVAAWPTFKDVPEFVVAIEFSSAEEAAKFEAPLNGMLPALLPPVTPPSSPSPNQKVIRPPSADQKPPAPVPGYALQRQGSLLIVSPAPVQLKKLRPAGSKPISEDPNFRVAYNRFASDPVFVFVDINAIEKEDEEQQKKWAEEEKKAEEARKAEQEKRKAEAPQAPEVPDVMQPGEEENVATVAPTATDLKPEETKEPTQGEIASAALTSMTYSLFAARPVLPDAVGVGFSPENDSFDVRALMMDGAGKTSDPVPLFLSWIKFGAPIAFQSPSVIPNDTDLVLTMSVDFQQLYTRMQTPAPQFVAVARTSTNGNLVVQPDGSSSVAPEPPLVHVEKLLKIKIKDDLLPVLGSEVAVSLPLTEYNFLGPPRPPAKPASKDDARESEAKETARAPFVVISIRDKEAMQRLLPKILEGFAGKAAAGLAQTERREDTELVSLAGMFAYAFVNNFLVLSNDPATVRHVVDSYLKGATLSADIPFRNYTRWQPHEVQGQVYVSGAFMENYKTWAATPEARISDEARAFFARLTTTPQPITYSLSNDGLGSLHELHVPKSILLLSLTGLASTANPPPTVKKEREAMGLIWMIANAERRYKDKNNSGYGSLDELLAGNFLTKEVVKSQDYKFEVTVTPEGYAVSAVPVEYGKTGKLSFFMDQTGTIRGADHAGAPASASDPPVSY